MDRVLNVYIHIPKCGGVSMTDALKETLGPEKVQIFGHFVIDKPLDTKAELIMGHIKFGCHLELEPAPNKVRYLTMVRDPVARLYSHWAYLMRQDQHRMNMGYEELVLSNKAIADNLMVRMLTGKDWCEWADVEERIGESDLRQAKYNLAQHFGWIGVLEYFGPSLKRLSDLLGVDIPKLHRNRWNEPVALPTELADLTREYNRYDQELYDWIKDTYYP